MFGFIKKLFNMKKEELEQQLAEAISTAQRLGVENKQLKEKNETLNTENTQLREELDSAIERVRYLASQVNMAEIQTQAKTQYSDNNRNY